MRISGWSADVCSSDLYYGGGFINTKAVAVFGQATYEIAEDLRLTLGARYSTEKKKALDNFLFDVVTPFDPNTSAALVLQPPAGTISLPGQKRSNTLPPPHIGTAQCRERGCEML